MFSNLKIMLFNVGFLVTWLNVPCKKIQYGTMSENRGKPNNAEHIYHEQI